MTFFDKYSFKQKNYALLILTVLILFVAYKRVFSTTIETLNYRDELEQKIEFASKSDKEIREQQLRLSVLNKYIGEENNSVEKVQQGFLNFFAERSNGLKVIQIDEVLNYKHPDFEINTHRIVLEGDYSNAIRFIYELEREYNLAKLLNVNFTYSKNDSNSSAKLYTTLLIQNYIK